jgi:hypothetical protein
MPKSSTIDFTFSNFSSLHPKACRFVEPFLQFYYSETSSTAGAQHHNMSSVSESKNCLLSPRYSLEKPFHFSQKSTTSSRHFSVSNNHIISLCYEVSPIHMHHLFALLLLVDWVGREQRAYPVTVL